MKKEIQISEQCSACGTVIYKEVTKYFCDACGAVLDSVMVEVKDSREEPTSSFQFCDWHCIRRYIEKYFLLVPKDMTKEVSHQ